MIRLHIYNELSGTYRSTRVLYVQYACRTSTRYTSRPSCGMIRGERCTPCVFRVAFMSRKARINSVPGTAVCWYIPRTARMMTKIPISPAEPNPGSTDARSNNNGTYCSSVASTVRSSTSNNTAGCTFDISPIKGPGAADYCCLYEYG